MRRPSQKSIDLYNRLVARANEVRKKLKRIHKREEEAFGAGRLPALIIPKSSHKVRANQFQGLSSAELHRRLKAYWANLSRLKEQFAQGLRSYLAKTVKDGYMELWRDQIEAFSGERPEGFHGLMFSKEQIEDSNFGMFMQTYNKLFRLSPEVFLAMLYTGRITAFKWIYLEMKDGRTAEGSWIQEQNELISLGVKDQTKLVKEVLGEEYDYKHSQRVLEKVERKEARARAKNER